MSKVYIHLRNKSSLAQKRLYGFRRTSSRQKTRKTALQRKNSLIDKENKYISEEFKKHRRYYRLYLDKYRDNNFHTYLSPYLLNKYFHVENDKNKCFSYIITKYLDFNKIINETEVRDIVFTKILRMTTADENEDIEDFICRFHEDILSESILKLYKNLDGYINTKYTSFYTYVINILPYYYYHSFISIYTKESNELQIKEKLKNNWISASETLYIPNLLLLNKLKKIIHS